MEASSPEGTTETLKLRGDTMGRMDRVQNVTRDVLAAKNLEGWFWFMDSGLGTRWGSVDQFGRIDFAR